MEKENKHQLVPAENTFVGLSNCFKTYEVLLRLRCKIDHGWFLDDMVDDTGKSNWLYFIMWWHDIEAASFIRS